MKRYFFLFVAALAALAFSSLRAAQAQAPTPAEPSFSCAKPQGPIEAAICASPTLSAADRQLAELYAAAGVSAFGAGPSNELAFQREALNDMRGCAKPGGKETIAACLADQYARRNSALALATLMDSPDRALSVIRKTDPAYAPVAEAVQVWASEPRDADWASPDRAQKRARILERLRPFMTDLLTKDDQSYGRDILTTASGDAIAVKRIEDVFISERHFATFLNILGPYLTDEAWPGRNPSARRSLPCAAIVRHPALLAATDAVFGSTMDNFVLDTDCAETLPPTPAVDALSAKLNKAWPNCDGTIRFAAYRMFESALNAARLGVVKHDLKAAAPRRRGVAATDMQAARTELTAYYVAYLGKDRATAAGMATDAVNAILSSAQQCE
ncbi:hypothetical protein CCR94_12920 [Rhodoblastus sphagnicola]|uniref:Lysozyme inhibitor LprI N-terminal domain-containing protein n=1 Tax=Rhodoblastus sphagnicola TaxID=333368 RepID=A0A2S6N6J2_9HYPH|nr:hypothetical protein [Rhodoblastus sphagnicola]MBB4197675.1 uncharacterized protein YecT (DUF1311 family) [Rhodoblastus sphagnicola]PPQ30222.1 hypothetical protein CCR94_12920 [Rhodoblastus sphagnicola]